MSGKITQTIKARFKDWKQARKARLGQDLQDLSRPEARKKAQTYIDWVDHGILRRHWHNFAKVAPGLYRSNQPDHARLADYAARGITTIVNLRGPSENPPYRLEVASCKALGLRLIDLPLNARRSPTKAELLAVLDVLEALEAPTLLHCKSGADRTGLVAAIYLSHVLGRPFSEARKMLSIRFVHLNVTKTGILDYVFDLYGRRAARAPISFRDWVTQEYDPVAARQEFDRLGVWQRIKL